MKAMKMKLILQIQKATRRVRKCILFLSKITSLNIFSGMCCMISLLIQSINSFLPQLGVCEENQINSWPIMVLNLLMKRWKIFLKEKKLTMSIAALTTLRLKARWKGQIRGSRKQLEGMRLNANMRRESFVYTRLWITLW